MYLVIIAIISGIVKCNTSEDAKNIGSVRSSLLQNRPKHSSHGCASAFRLNDPALRQRWGRHGSLAVIVSAIGSAGDFLHLPLDWLCRTLSIVLHQLGVDSVETKPFHFIDQVQAPGSNCFVT